MAIVIVLLISAPTRADAHGLGGLTASNTTAQVVSIHPATSDFFMKSTENGALIRITQLSTRTIYVLGVDGEKYIRITTSGTYLNEKSATVLINKSTSTTQSLAELTKEFAKTSDDPTVTPVWNKVSSSRTYAWHDHRAHYMGTVPPGILDLGTNQLAVRVGNTHYSVSIAFRTAHTRLTAIPFIILGLFVLLLFIGALWFHDILISVLNRSVTIVALVGMEIFEFIHVCGYMSFAQQSVVAETASSLYGIVLIILAACCVYKIVQTRSRPWIETLRDKAPLLCATGFVGIMAGTIIEYRTLIDPFPASTFSSGVARLCITCVGCLSAAVFALGLIHIKQVQQKEKKSVSSLTDP